MGDLPHLSPLFTDEDANFGIALKTLQNLQRFKPHIRFIRYQWQDLSGILRARVTPMEYALQLATTKKYIQLSPVSLHCIADNTYPPWTSRQGSHSLVADWSSVKIINENGPGPSYATVMCGAVCRGPKQPIPDSGLCPRRALETVVRKALGAYGLRFLIGLEVEFVVMKLDTTTGEMVLASEGLGRYAVDGLRDPCYQHVETAVQELLDSGVNIQAIHSEGAQGQYEISLSPLPPLQAIDTLMLVDDTLKRVFAREGYVVTMSPLTVSNQRQGTAQHAHLSINPSIKEDNFLAGILQRLPQLFALALPYEISYARAKPNMAGDVVAWGTENRTTAIRKINTGHWELRFIDATTNMYLTLAAALSAGLLGVQNEEPLLWPDMTFSEDSASALSKSQLLPRSLEEALEFLQERFSDLESMMENRIVQHYMLLKRYEIAQLRRMDVKERMKLLLRLF